HIHGGKFTSMRAHQVIPSLIPFVSQSSLPFLAVDYRRALEFPFQTPLENCWTALLFLQLQIKRLGIDVNKIAVWRKSAGGALAASISLVARDRDFLPPLTKQILIYPMLDDR
ncbi:hypothetical protein COCC4DRAFT_90053, partial [Bipolaris maydis ATCC 48331]